MELSVIIPTYNRADILRRTLNLLGTQTLDRRVFDVVVVNDGSTDDTERTLREYEGAMPYHLTWASQENAGQGTARNRGIEMAQGKILLFLGDDMLPQPSCLQDHLRFHVLHGGASEVCLGFVRWHPELRVNRFMHWLDHSGVQFKFHDLMKDQVTDWRRFYTANISIKRAFLAEDRFDTDFHGWGFEDTELGYRLHQRGMRLTYWPDSVVEHLHEMTDAGLEQRMQSAGRNAVLFAQKHPEAGLLPSPGKRLAQEVVARLTPWRYWSRAKRAYLAGVRSAQHASSNTPS